MIEAAAAAPPPARTLPCPRCRVPMDVADLHAATGPTVEADLCSACRLVWFDEREAPRLSGLGWISLLARLQHEVPARDAWSGEALACGLCAQPLAEQANQTRYGRFTAHCCPRGHGALRSEAMLLAERGLVRPPSTVERLALQAEQGQWMCLNCGGPIGDGDACSWCRTPLLLIDLPRLALSLRPQGAGMALPPRTGARDTWACHGCGQVLDPTRDSACAQCGHPVLARLPQHLRPLLQALDSAWRDWLDDPANAHKMPSPPNDSRSQRRAPPREPVPDPAAARALGWKVWSGSGVFLALLWVALLV